MTLLAQRISPAGREVNLQGSTHLFRLSNTLNTYHSSSERDKWRVQVYWITQYPGLIQNSHSNVFKLGKRYLFLDNIKVSVKENEVPTEKDSSRASIFATKASYISN